MNGKRCLAVLLAATLVLDLTGVQVVGRVSAAESKISMSVEPAKIVGGQTVRKPNVIQTTWVDVS